MNRNEALTLARTLLDQHGLSYLPVEFNRTTKALGQTEFRVNRIFDTSEPVRILLSTVYVDILPVDEIREVVLHEIAHAIAGHRAGHGPAWRSVARRVGATPERCMAPSVQPDMPWEGRCDFGHTSARKFRAPKAVRACGKCSSRFAPEYILRWYKNGKAVPLSEMPKEYQQKMQRYL